MDKTIVILAGRKPSTNVIYNSLKNCFQVEKVIIEQPVPLIQSFKKRVKRLGLCKVIGQALFLFIIVSYWRIMSRKRIQELKKCYELDDTPVDISKMLRVPSANSAKTIDALQKINPDIVLINGTRIISKEIIDCIPAKFINMHAGITPLYRGVYGAYWSLAEFDKKACGVTIHFVDTGIDTGNILEQGLIEPSKEDNVVTYPLLQLAIGIPLLRKAISDIFENRIKIELPPEGKSKFWSHPTIWEYIWYRIRYGIK